MPFLILLFVLFGFALYRGDHTLAMGVLLMIIASFLATFWPPFRKSIENQF